MPSMDGKKTIVVVEDEKTLAHLIALKLTDAGYDVKVAEDGGTGLELIRSEKPDLVLLDILLPVMNGFTILEELSKDGMLPKLPVIVISNSGQPVEIDRALKLGVRDYLVKVNFSPPEVLEKVEHLFQREKENPMKPVTLEQVSGGKGPRVLIIEDDLILIELLERKFVQQDFRTWKALNVNDARKILKENMIDVILLDIVLPGTDGFTYLNELKSDPQFKNIPVIIISNLGQKEEIDRGIKGGAVDYIVKAKVLPTEIVGKVQEILSRLKK